MSNLHVTLRRSRHVSRTLRAWLGPVGLVSRRCAPLKPYRCDLSHDTFSESAHRLFESVVVPLLMTAGVAGAAGGGQRLQDRADQGGALGGEVARQDPGTLERGLQADGPVLEGPARVIVTGVRAGAGLDLSSQGGQVAQVHALTGRAGQDLIGGVAALPGEPVGPPAQ